MVSFGGGIGAGVWSMDSCLLGVDGGVKVVDVNGSARRGARGVSGDVLGGVRGVGGGVGGGDSGGVGVGGDDGGSVGM